MAGGTALGLLSAAIQDGLSYLQIPGTTVLGQAIEKLNKQRLDNARQIALEEVREGSRTLLEAGQLDEFAAIISRYGRAAIEGAARTNLRLMAKIMAGQAANGRLLANEFLAYADILASMRREEIILVATIYRHATSAAVLALKAEDRDTAAMKASQEEVIPASFPTEDDFFATLGAILRTGLIVSRSGYGGTFYRPSPLLTRLWSSAEFEATTRRD